MLRSKSIDDKCTDFELRTSIVGGDGSKNSLAGTNLCRISDKKLNSKFERKKKIFNIPR